MKSTNDTRSATSYLSHWPGKDVGKEINVFLSIFLLRFPPLWRSCFRVKLRFLGIFLIFFLFSWHFPHFPCIFPVFLGKLYIFCPFPDFLGIFSFLGIFIYFVVIFQVFLAFLFIFLAFSRFSWNFIGFLGIFLVQVIFFSTFSYFTFLLYGRLAPISSCFLSFSMFLY